MTSFIIQDLSTQKVFKYFDHVFETKFDFLFIQKDTQVFLIGEDSDDLAVLLVYRLDDLLAGKPQGQPCRLAAVSLTASEQLLTRVICYQIQQNQLVVGGSRGELIQFIIENDVSRHIVHLERQQLTSETEKITNVSIYKVIKSKNDDEIELVVSTENQVNLHCFQARRNDSNIIFIDTLYGAEILSLAVSDIQIYLACKKLAKIKCYKREIYKQDLHCDYIKLKIIKLDKYIGVLLNDLEHEKQIQEMISCETEHRHKGLILKDQFIKSIQILKGKIQIFFIEKDKLKQFILKELDIKGKIEELKKKNFQTQAIDLAKDHLSSNNQSQLRDLQKEQADRNFKLEKHNIAIQYQIKAAEIDNEQTNDSEYKILDPFVVINKYKNIGRTGLCTQLENLFLRFKKLQSKQFNQHKEQQKLLINYLVNHLVATNSEDSLIKILNEDDIRRQIDMKQFNKVCSNNMNRKLSEKVFKMNKDYELLAIILVEERDFSTHLLREVLAHIREKPDRSRSRAILEFIIKYYFVLKQEQPHELVKFIKEVFTSTFVEIDIIHTLMNCEELDDQDIFDILEIVIFKYNQLESDFINQQIKICIINHKETNFKTEQDLIEIITEQDQYLDTEDIQMTCITYDFDLGIEKYAFKMNDQLFLYEQQNKILDYDKLVTICLSFYKKDTNLIQMTLRSLVHSKLKAQEIDTKIINLLSKIDCELDWSIIINTVKLNKLLHISCIKNLMKIKQEKEIIQVKENKSQINKKQREVQQLQETSKKLSTIGIKQVFQFCSLCRNELDSGKTVVFRCGHEVHQECMDHTSNQDYQHDSKMESGPEIRGFEGVQRANMVNYADKQSKSSLNNQANNKLNIHSNNNESYQCPCCMVEKNKIQSQQNQLYAEKLPDIQQFISEMKDDDYEKKGFEEKDKILILAKWLKQDLWRDDRQIYKKLNDKK